MNAGPKSAEYFLVRDMVATLGELGQTLRNAVFNRGELGHAHTLVQQLEKQYGMLAEVLAGEPAAAAADSIGVVAVQLQRCGDALERCAKALEAVTPEAPRAQIRAHAAPEHQWIRIGRGKHKCGRCGVRYQDDQPGRAPECTDGAPRIREQGETTDEQPPTKPRPNRR